MSKKGSLFLFEFIVEDFKSFVEDGQEFVVSVAFADVFNITLKRFFQGFQAKPAPGVKHKRRHKSRSEKSKETYEPKLKMGQTILFEHNIKSLRQKMENNPLVLSIHDLSRKRSKLGSTEVPWRPQYLEYLDELPYRQDTPTIVLTTKHKIYNEKHSDLLVFLKITTKVSHLVNTSPPVQLINVHDYGEEKEQESENSEESPSNVGTCTEAETYESKPTVSDSLISFGENVFGHDEIESLTFKEVNQPIDILMLCLRNSTQALVNRTNSKSLLPAVKSRSTDLICENVQKVKSDTMFHKTMGVGQTDFYVYGLKNIIRKITKRNKTPDRASDSNKPASDSKKPASDSKKPASDSKKPASASKKPADSNKPATDSKKPGDEPKKKDSLLKRIFKRKKTPEKNPQESPKKPDSKGPSDNKKPVSKRPTDNKKPVSDSKKPASDSKKPRADSKKPEDGSKKKESLLKRIFKRKKTPEKKPQEDKKPVSKLPSDIKKPDSRRPSAVSKKPADSKKPASDSEEPAADTKKPAAESKKPDADSTKPAADSKKPDADSKKPDTDSKTPGADTKKPDADSKKPGTDTKNPDADSKKPDVDSKKPGADSKKPDEDSKKDKMKKPASADKKDKDEKYQFAPCESTCQKWDESNKMELDLPESVADLITVTKCKEVDCENRIYRPIPERDDRILMDMDTEKERECCQAERGDGKKKLAHTGDDGEPCYCTCECSFEFEKKTEYCEICGGYTKVGETLETKRSGQPLPFPCPMYLKRLESSSSISSKSVKGKSEFKKEEEQSIKQNDDRFKFRRGYEGIPLNIGHERCKLPAGTECPCEPVPADMGWNWKADNIAGWKYRPEWKPGCCHKKVVKLLKNAAHPEILIAKKRKVPPPKKDPGRPLLVVKKDETGEFIISIEAMKKYNKERLVNQKPYVEQDPIYFTVGKTDEEKLAWQKRKQRRARLLEYDQREFIQMQFRNLCHKVCLRVYRQALQELKGTEYVDCETVSIDEELPPLPPCTCKECELSSESTDEDQWIINYTPPFAKYRPDYMIKKVQTVDHTTQYCYLDYKVQVLDKKGKQVPRFFLGPEKQECSDLGGFWGPNKKWLEINVDGFIAPDGRWAPFMFTGPEGEQVDCEADGTFQLKDGRRVVVGVDGYVDYKGNWKFYKPLKPLEQKIDMNVEESHKPEITVHSGVRHKKGQKQSLTGLNCYGDATPEYLSKLGIQGHGHDREVLTAALREMIDRGEKIRIPNWEIPHLKKSKGKARARKSGNEHKCRHPKPPSRGILAVDRRGHKTYFTTTANKNQNMKKRIDELTKVGVNMSAYHLPCMKSFTDSETMKKERYRHILNHNSRIVKNVTYAPTPIPTPTFDYV